MLARSAPASDLKIKVQGPHTINDVADLKLNATITNTSDGALTLVDDPSGVLSSSIPTERYRVVNSSGAKPKFIGAVVKFSPQRAAELGCVIVLEPGQAVTVDHDLSSIYDFTNPGPGRYTFSPKDSFYSVDPSTKNLHLIKGSSSSIFVEISGRLVK